MYQNESIDDYIRSVLGYPNNNSMYVDNNQMDYFMMNQQANRNEELERCYPEIYRILYPMINNRCSRIAEPITSELIDSITDEIYSAIEVNNEINLNINLQNTTATTTNNRAMSKEAVRNQQTQENRQENRQFRNRNLQDLIKILIIRELLNRPGDWGRPPMRPPMPPPGRPPFPGGPRTTTTIPKKSCRWKAIEEILLIVIER